MDSWEQITELRREGVPAVVVTITSVRGSVPGRAGAKAVVTHGGLVSGNLGGGKVEAKAIGHAVGLMQSDFGCDHVTWNLQRDVGMTCGGEMSFLFESIASGDRWRLVVFGAGHVSQAVVPVLSTLACRIDVVDTREDWLDRFVEKHNVTTHLVESAEEGVAWVEPGSFVLSITQGHSSDRPVLRDVLRKFPAIPFLGVIGSASKRAVLMRELREDGIAEELLEKIICPVGLPIGGNDPAEIAISIAAQLLDRRK
jgi:xanthine dehydrogenase accessory factor